MFSCGGSSVHHARGRWACLWLVFFLSLQGSQNGRQVTERQQFCTVARQTNGTTNHSGKSVGQAMRERCAKESDSILMPPNQAPFVTTLLEASHDPQNPRQRTHDADHRLVLDALSARQLRADLLAIRQPAQAGRSLEDTIGTSECRQNCKTERLCKKCTSAEPMANDSWHIFATLASAAGRRRQGGPTHFAVILPPHSAVRSETAWSMIKLSPTRSNRSSFSWTSTTTKSPASSALPTAKTMSRVVVVVVCVCGRSLK